MRLVVVIKRAHQDRDKVVLELGQLFLLLMAQEKLPGISCCMLPQDYNGEDQSSQIESILMILVSTMYILPSLISSPSFPHIRTWLSVHSRL
jgi:hypothetical protein